MNFPQDPVLLMSVVNTYLRDQYSSLEALCDDRDWDIAALRTRLEGAGFTYMPAQNQFR